MPPAGGSLNTSKMPTPVKASADTPAVPPQADETTRKVALSARTIALGILVLTIGQLIAGTFVPSLTQFADKGFGARLLAYPVLMLILPALWLIRDRRRRSTSTLGEQTSRPAPWAAFAWIMLPFLIDVTGNTLNLYDTIWWWDDVNHVVNWFFLSLGIGLLLSRTELRPVWALFLAIVGLGALLAIGWELGEYVTFIRHSSELATAYTDTLGDEANGTLGATLAALLITRRIRAARSAGGD